MSDNKDQKIVSTIIDEVKLIKEALKVNASTVIKEMTEDNIEEEIEETYSIDEVTDDEESEGSESEEMENDGESEETETEETETEDGEESEEGESEEEMGDLSTDLEDVDMDDLSDDTEEIDLTSASEEQIMAVYKKMTDNDEIEVVDNGDSLDLNVKVPGEYIIKDEEPKEDEVEMDSFDDLSSTEDDDIDYEIDEADLEEVLSEMMNDKIDEEESKEESEEESEVNESEEEVVSEEDHEEEEMVDEKMSKTMADRHQQQIRPDTIEPLGRSMNESVEKSVYDDLKSRYDLVMEQKKEISNVVSELKSLLHETMLTNANLAYFSKIVTENVTSKDEKREILERFDNVSNIKESKELFLTISKEVKANNVKKQAITESKDNLTSSFSGTIKENTTFVNEGITKMLEIMNEMDKRK